MKKINQKKGINLTLFLPVIVFLAYILAFLFDTNKTLLALENFFLMFIRLIPIFGIVFVIMIIVNKYFSFQTVQKHLGSNSKTGAWLFSIFAGILISGPPYMLYPILKDLKNKGMKYSLIAVILYNRNVKIPFIPALIYYFGLTFTITISLYIIIFSVLNGLLVEYLTNLKNPKDL